MAINTQDTAVLATQGVLFTQPLLLFMQFAVPDAQYLGIVSFSGAQVRFARPIWIWRKQNRSSAPTTDQDAPADRLNFGSNHIDLATVNSTPNDVPDTPKSTSAFHLAHRTVACTQDPAPTNDAAPSTSSSCLATVPGTGPAPHPAVAGPGSDPAGACSHTCDSTAILASGAPHRNNECASAATPGTAAASGTQGLTGLQEDARAELRLHFPAIYNAIIAHRDLLGIAV